MSMVTTLVSLSQFIRALSNKLRTKAIKAIELRIAKVECEQRRCEAHRSKQMIECHNSYYADRDKLNADYNKELEALESKFTQRLNRIDSDFATNKSIIATSHQGASNQLKRELAMLGSELDNLTK